MYSERSSDELYVLGRMINDPGLQGDAHRIFVHDPSASHIHNVVCANSGSASRGIIGSLLAEYRDSEWGAHILDYDAVLDAVDVCVELAKSDNERDYQDIINCLGFC